MQCLLLLKLKIKLLIRLLKRRRVSKNWKGYIESLIKINLKVVILNLLC